MTIVQTTSAALHRILAFNGADTVYVRPRIEDIELPSRIGSNLWLAITILAFILLVVVGASIVDAIRNRRGRRTALRRLLDEAIRQSGLDEAEARLYSRIVSDHGGIPGPLAFERGVRVLLDAGESPETLHQLRLKLGMDRIETDRPLASTRECEPGQTVSLTDQRNVWRVEVVDVTEAYLELRAPREAGTLENGAEIKASFLRTMEAHYFFQTTVLQVIKDETSVRLRVAHPEDLSRHQDREFVRAAVAWSLDVRPVPKDRLDENGLPEATPKAFLSESAIPVKVTDISGGGVQLTPVEVIEVNDVIVLPLPIEDGEGALDVFARALRKDRAGVHCRFENLTVKCQDRIHRQILRERRRQR